jgi:hypothetical protein
VGGDAAFWRTLKSGAFVLAGAGGASSSTAKLIISTMLETSFFIFSGRVEGSCFPTSFRLHRYIARANSGKCSCPDRVVSARVLFPKLVLSILHVCSRWLHHISEGHPFYPVFSPQRKHQVKPPTKFDSTSSHPIYFSSTDPYSYPHSASGPPPPHS